MFKNIYKDKKIFLTAHSRFKGSCLNFWLTNIGTEVFGYSLEPETNPSLHKILKQCNGIYANILDEVTLEKAMQDLKPDIIFHLAAQPIVRRSYNESVLTYKTNFIGTLNVFEALNFNKYVLRI